MNKNSSLFSLNAKTAFISGATGYLGTEIAYSLAEAGAEVYINSRNKNDCSLLAKEMQNKGLKAIEAAFDITNPDSVSNFFDKLDTRALDIIVNNAYSGKGGTIETSQQEDYLNAYNLTVGAAHSIMKQGLKNLRIAAKNSGYASIINISSMYAVVSPDHSIYTKAEATNPPFYGSAKAALLQLTRYAACEFAKDNIRVNSLILGPFPALEVQENEPDFIDKLKKKVPLGRVGIANEIRGPILFLASPASSFVTGSEIIVDGGWTSW